MSKFEFTQRPQLVMRRNRNLDGRCIDVWAISCSALVGGEEHFYEVQVRVAWDGETWNHFKFYEVVMGTEIELATEEEYQARLQAIRDHESDEVAEAWHRGQETVRVIRIRGLEVDIREALIRRWNAVSELVFPQITI